MVDYVGAKSSFMRTQKNTEVDNYDPLRLYVAGLPHDTKEANLRKIFPKATDITLPMSKKRKQLFGYGFVTFTSSELSQFHDNT